jgi:hypothetical protein
VPPGLHVAVVPDSMVMSTGRIGEGLGAVGTPVRLLAGVNVLMCFEMKLGREALTALRADNRANLQVNSSNMPLHQTGARLETTLNPACIVPDTLGLSTANPPDIVVGVDGRRGAGSGRRLHGLVLGGKSRRRWSRGCPWGASGGMRVARGVTVMMGAGGCWVRVGS